jgi:WYL_2, Sm-like SH3 beta-barrel fold
MQTVFSNEKEFETFKDWTYGLLRDPNAKDLCIVFTKKDGTEREMFCTLVESKIPEDKRPQTQEEKSSQTSGSAVRVFDTEKQEWRSFRWDSVKKVNFDL